MCTRGHLSGELRGKGGGEVSWLNLLLMCTRGRLGGGGGGGEREGQGGVLTEPVFGPFYVHQRTPIR